MADNDSQDQAPVHDHSREELKTRKDAFASVALWQFLSFAMLVCFVWASETLDAPARFFGVQETPFNMFRCFFLSAGVITAGVIAVGHTYLKQKAIVEPFQNTCAFCHRIQTNAAKHQWEHVDEYVINTFPVSLEKGACPECQTMLDATLSRQKKKDAAG